MEVHLTPDLEKQLTRNMLDRRYDEIESGEVTPIGGEESFARLHERIDARRSGLA